MYGDGPAVIVCSTWSLPGEKLDVSFVPGSSTMVANDVELYTPDQSACEGVQVFHRVGWADGKEVIETLADGAAVGCR